MWEKIDTKEAGHFLVEEKMKAPFYQPSFQREKMFVGGGMKLHSMKPILFLYYRVLGKV